MLRQVARDGTGRLRLTVLGPHGTVQGFDAFWEAAAVVIDGLAPPQEYPHHRLGQPDELVAMTEAGGWVDVKVREVVGRRRCNEETLWSWLWSSLPLLRTDGSYVDSSIRDHHAAAIRDELFARARRWSDGTALVVESAALLVSATASTTAPPLPSTIDTTVETGP